MINNLYYQEIVTSQHGELSNIQYMSKDNKFECNVKNTHSKSSSAIFAVNNLTDIAVLFVYKNMNGVVKIVTNCNYLILLRVCYTY